MKRLIALIFTVMLAAGCAATPDGTMGLERSALLPDGTVAGITGEALKPTLEERDDATGIVRWAWEESDGTPKLLVVEVRFPPADCDALYNRAQAGQGATAVAVPPQAVACSDGRAAHLRFGEYYARIATLGMKDESGVTERLAARLVAALTPKK